MSHRSVGPNCCFASVRLRRARMDGFGTRCRQTSARPAQIRIMQSDGRPASPLVLSIPSERVGARRDLHSTPSDCFRTVLIDALRRASDTRGLRTSCGHVRRRLATRTRPACRYQPRRRTECRSQRGVKYIWWHWRNFVPYIYTSGFRRHLVGKTLRNVCYSYVTSIRFVARLMIMWTLC